MQDGEKTIKLLLYYYDSNLSQIMICIVMCANFYHAGLEWQEFGGTYSNKVFSVADKLFVRKSICIKIDGLTPVLHKVKPQQSRPREGMMIR